MLNINKITESDKKDIKALTPTLQDNNQEIPSDIDVFSLSKYKILPVVVDGAIHLGLPEGEDIELSLDYLSKAELPYPLIILDKSLFNKISDEINSFKTQEAVDNIEKINVIDESDADSLSNILEKAEDLVESEDSPPIVRFVNSLFLRAIQKEASDIHIETHQKYGNVRFRIDGILIDEVSHLSKKAVEYAITRIKVMSNLDISEKRIPQDGRIQLMVNKKTTDVRVSVLPTYYGERVVMRILQEQENIPELPELGFTQEITKQLDSLLKNSHGIILVTGPTGSGKSTTLHSFLNRIYSPEKNIITIEDPVEYKSDKINQIQVNTKAGLTFASGLRSILRQDPDIIMVGEIRDKETAQISIQAALTGHLVFSTLHTNTATGAITRLMDMGIEHYLIASSLIGVLAQRLVRQLCPHCKIEDKLGEEFTTEFNLPSNTRIYKAKEFGCSHCNGTGYKGRKAIGELFVLDDGIKTLIKGEVNDHLIRQKAVEKGMKTLSMQLQDLIIQGKTSIDEAIRVGLKEG